MDSLIIVSSRRPFAENLATIIARTSGTTPTLVLLPTVQEATDYLEVEMPELFFLDVSDPDLDPWWFLEIVQADSWLMQGGIVAIGDNHSALSPIDGFRGANVVVSLTTIQLDRALGKIMEIIVNNRRLLHQVDLTSDLVRDISGSFRLTNDLLEVTCYANLLGNFLFASNRIDLEQKNGLVMVLVEMLVNAVEHGNCGISFEEKTAWLESGRFARDLIEERCRDPKIGARTVLFEYVLRPEGARFLIVDEGDGFDWRKRLEHPLDDASLDLHGRGLSLARGWTQDLAFNEKGNELTFSMAYRKTGTPFTPTPFRELRQLELTAGQEVFKAGDPSDSLYYIVKGRFEVINSSGVVVGTLSPDDLFVGEMSFLLDSHRSASVRAASDGRLIKITKREFVEAVRRKPHYALLLSRLLARRLSRLNARFISGG